LWLENASRFGVSKNEEIEYYVDKYLTMLSNKICSLQIHQHKRTHGKTNSTNLSILISKTTNKTYKNVIAFR
jgi:hypothetical protein